MSSEPLKRALLAPEPLPATTLIQNLRAAVIILDSRGRITHFNRAAEILSGYRLEETLGLRPWDFLLKSDDAKLVAEAFNNLRTSGLQTELECEWIRRNGEVRVVQWSNAPVLDEAGTLKWTVETVIDLTEEREVEHEIKSARDNVEVERHISQFLSETSYRLSLIDPNVGKRVDALCSMAVPFLADWSYVIVQNGGAEGYLESACHWDSARSPAIERLLSMAGRLEAGKVLFESSTQPCLPTRGIPFTIRTENERKLLEELGCDVWARFPIELGRAADSRGALFLAVGTKRHTEFDANCRIGMEFARRAAPLLVNALLYEELQKATRLRDDFLAIASHELRTPITPLLMQVGLIERHLRSGTFQGYEKKHELLEVISGSVRQLEDLIRLVNDMTDVSQINLNRFAPHRRKMNLAESVRSVVNVLANPISRSGCTISVESQDVYGYWDPARIEQVVTNLVTNAIKFGAGEPVEIKVTSSPVSAILQVRDHGIGVPAKEQSRIFGRFERSSSQARFPGLGLGLYITRQIVLAHQGTIRLESELGKGSTFVVELPFGVKD